MSAPILVPAFACVLRAGLPVLEPEHGAFVLVDTYEICVAGNSENSDASELRALIGRRVIDRADVDVSSGRRSRHCDIQRGDVPASCLRLNLRVPAVRDALVRALWRKLRPSDDEPHAAPMWVPHDSDAVPAWSLATMDGDGDADSIYFAEQIGETAPDDSMAIPSLANCYAEDGDLLALAEVAKSVLS